MAFFFILLVFSFKEEKSHEQEVNKKSHKYKVINEIKIVR